MIAVLCHMLLAHQLRSAFDPLMPSQTQQQTQTPFDPASCMQDLKEVGIIVSIDNSCVSDSQIDTDAVRDTVTKRLKEVGIQTISNDDWQKYNDSHPDTPMPYIDVDIFVDPNASDGSLNDTVTLDLMDYVALQRDDSVVFDTSVWGHLAQSTVPKSGLSRIGEDADLNMLWFEDTYRTYNPDAKPLDSN